MLIDRELIGLFGLLILFLFLILRMPVGLALVIVGIGGNYILSLFVPHLKFAAYLKSFKTLLWGVYASYDLSIIPLFILMGYFASRSNLSYDLFQGFNALMGRLRGGVAIAAIGSCAGFGAVCGSSLATSSTMGRVALPELRRMKYSSKLATGTLAAGGTLGILIPPSLVLVIYAIIVEASIIEMFQAAIIPGLMAVLFFILVILVQIHLRPQLAPIAAPMDLAEKKQAISRLIPTILIFGGIILGIGLGLFAPTPAASVGASAIFIYGIILHRYDKTRGLNLNRIKSSILDTAVTSGMIYFILFGTEVLKGFFARSNLPSEMAFWLSTSNIDPWIILIILLVSLIIFGCFMDSLAMILVVVPFLWPALVEINGGDFATSENAVYGMNAEDLKIWFGILALVVIELGLITPPMGLNVFVISTIAKNVKMGEIFKGVMPFFCVEILRVIILILFPFLCLFLPHYFAG